MKIKKHLALLLAACMILAPLASCDKNDTNTADGTEASTIEATTPATDAPEDGSDEAEVTSATDESKDLAGDPDASQGSDSQEESDAAPDDPVMPEFSASATGLTYEVNDDGVSCTITGIGTCTDSNLRIANTIDGYTVTAIGQQAFYGCNTIVAISIPDSVTLIDIAAFSDCNQLKVACYEGNLAQWLAINFTSGNSSPACNGAALYIDGHLVKNVVIPEGTTKIGYAAFSGCTSLSDITIPNSVTSIGGFTFAHCTSLTKITIPDSITSIDGFVFYKNPAITSITIPNSVTSIGRSAFEGCTSLTDIYYKGTIAEWNDIASNSYWNLNTGSYTVHCTDGDIAKA